MIKHTILLFLLFGILSIYAENYYVINFEGEGVSVETVIVENLTQGTSVELAGTDVLHLILGESNIKITEAESNKLKIYPNPMGHFCNIEFINADRGNVNIKLYSITGKQMCNYNKVLTKGMHTFSLTGVSAGLYVISVLTETDFFTERLVSTRQTVSLPSLTYKGAKKSSNAPENKEPFDLTFRNAPGSKGSKSIVEMDFNDGDLLKFIGHADGFFNSIIYDSPISDNTYIFQFIEQLGQCDGLTQITDPRDGNVYNTIGIGEQCWMAENLAYLPDITYEDDWFSYTEPQYAVYGYVPGSGTETVAEAKTSENYNIYGVLYNWAAAMNGAEGSDENPSGVQGACPPGWHLPSIAEWDELIDYVESQGYPNIPPLPDGAGNALKSCRQVDSPLGGNCDTNKHPRWNSHHAHFGTDKFGFAALPGGRRESNNFVHIGRLAGWWSATDFDTPVTTTAACRILHNDMGGFDIIHDLAYVKIVGLSIRCIRD